MLEKGFTTAEKTADNIDAYNSGMLSSMIFDYACGTKYMVHHGLYCKTLKNLGTERHRQQLLDGCACKTLGAYCLTEIGHGSNVRGMELTATYDNETKEFVFKSPTNTSLKFWIGNLAKTAHNAVVFAQLLLNEDGKIVNKGVHAFVLEIRDRSNHVPLPGIMIGDCGDKLGLHGVDNGWIKFDDFRAPRETLLNKFGDVSEDGKYTSSIKSPGKRFANSIASLSSGRVLISRISHEHALNAVSIALRYASVRRQFGPSGRETLLLDYPLHQFRLIPRFANHLINFVASNKLFDIWNENLPKLLEEGNNVTALCHALSSSMKSYAGWTSQDTIAECRRACGGHGYSYYSNFATLISFNDLHATWEGDASVLLQQTQKFILSNLKAAAKGGKLPMTLEFLILNQTTAPTYTGEFDDVKALQKLFQQRASYLTLKAAKALSVDPKKFDLVFAELQPFELRDMCLAYHETYGIDTFIGFLDNFTDAKTKKVFEKLLLVHMQYRILMSPAFFTQAVGSERFETVRPSVGALCKDLRKEMIQLTDVLPFPNTAMGALGNEDLQVYDRYIQHIMTAPKVTERPSWWKMLYQH